MEENKSSKQSCLKNIDMFGPSFQMEIKKGEGSLNTSSGALLTISMFAVMIIYTYLRGDVFLSKSKMSINQAIEMKYFDESYEFQSKDGFSIAAMFTAYDDNPDPILDPTYGELLIRYTRWG